MYFEVYCYMDGICSGVIWRHGIQVLYYGLVVWLWMLYISKIAYFLRNIIYSSYPMI